MTITKKLVYPKALKARFTVEHNLVIPTLDLCPLFGLEGLLTNQNTEIEG